MARKKIGRILSGGAIVLCVFMFCTLDISGQGFIAEKETYTISGSAGVSGVTMKGLPGNPVTDASGYYTATVDYGWKGTVIPDKEGFTFTPSSKVYPNVTSNLANEDYIPTAITYTISGKVNIEGVEMSGLPGNPITGSDGTYSVTVEWGWKGTVTPIKEGYEFTPSNRGYPPLKMNQTNQDYTSKQITLVISGSAGAEGAVMEGLPGNPISGKNGMYSAEVEYKWSGTVTPKKEGYVFSPVDRTYTTITTAQSIENYAATLLTYTISGTAGMASVTMRGLPGNPITDENGYYTATVDHGFSGTVTPTIDGYRFTPASMIYTSVNSERINQNYSPSIITLTISGTTRLEGVEMNGLPNNPITSKDGSYSVTVDYGWNGTVTPVKEGYNFIPANKPYPSVTSDLTNQNYTPEKITFIISGSAGVSGVTMTGLPGKAVVTGPGGTYSTIVEWGWSGKVTPTKDGYEFQPTYLEYQNLMGPQTNQSYTATLLKRRISGKIISEKGQPVEDVFLLAEPDGGSGTTDINGQYELSVNHGWRGKVTPTKDGYTFRTTYKQYAIVTTDQTNQDFTAIVQTFTISDVVMLGQTPIEGVLITATNEGGTTYTDSSGRFSIKVPYGWTGEIIPTKEGIKFNPPSMPYTNITQNYKNGTPELPKIPPETKPTVVTKPPVTPTPVEPNIPAIPKPKPTPEPNKVTPVPEAEPSEMEKEMKRIKELLERMTRGKPGAEEITPIPPELLKPEVPLISNTFVDNDLPTEVLPAIAAQAGISIIPEDTVTGMVTCELREQPLDTALEIVLAGTPYVVKKTPYYYLVCSGAVDGPLFEKVSETKRVRMNYITAPAAVGLLSTAFRNYAQAELGPAGTDTYTVVVTAPPALMNRIVSDLKQIDLMPTQVLLDARVVVMERGDLLNLGVEWRWPTMQAGWFGSDHYGRGETSLDFGGKWPWGVQMGYTPDAIFTNSLELTLNLLAQNGEVTILAKPQVFAQDGKQAQIQVMNEEYYMLTAPEIPGFYYTRSELQEIQSGTKLTITPHIGDNNDITLQISVEVSDSIPRGRGSDLPVVTRRTAENNVTIKDGGTVALAGLTENKTRTDLKRVPGLSKLPLLGPLFRNSNNENSTREIAVFVTARIVPKYQPTTVIEPAPAQPSIIQAPVQPTGEDFRSQLRESLSSQIR